MRISIYRSGKLAPFSILCCSWLNALARASKDWKSFRSREKPHGTVCPPFWILTVEWAGARSCLFGWRHRFQIASFSPSTLENSVFKKHRFQIVPLWRAFSNDSVFGDRFRRCSVDDSRIRSKTAPFSFENGLVWTGLQCLMLCMNSLRCDRVFDKGVTVRTVVTFWSSGEASFFQCLVPLGSRSKAPSSCTL